VLDLWRGRSSFTLIHWLKQGEFIIRTECVTYGEVEAVFTPIHWLKQGDDSSHRHTGSSRPIHRSKFSSNGTECRDLWRGQSSFTPIHQLEQESFVMVKNHVAFHEKGPPPTETGNRQSWPPHARQTCFIHKPRRGSHHRGSTCCQPHGNPRGTGRRGNRLINGSASKKHLQESP
jgi:hypothetical protein